MAIPFDISAGVISNGKEQFSNTILNMFVGGHKLGVSFRPLLPSRYRHVSSCNAGYAAPSFLISLVFHGDLRYHCEDTTLEMCSKTNN